MTPTRTALLPLLTLLGVGCQGPVLGLDLGWKSIEAGVESDGLPDIVGIPNLDDDNGNETIDWRDRSLDDEDDLQTVTLHPDLFRKIPNDHTIRLRLSGDTDEIRVWHDGSVLLGEARDGSDPIEGAVLDESSLEDPLLVEFSDYLIRGTLHLEQVDEDGEVVAELDASMISSPLILNHHLQPAEHTWAVDVFENQDFIRGYEDALGDEFTAVEGPSVDWDVWIQDEIEFATMSGPNGLRSEIVIDSIRDRGLRRFAERELFGPGTGIGVWGDRDQVTSQDSFGNLEVTPPFEGYPMGRIYYGDAGGRLTVAEELQEFLDDQKVQKPFELDVSWLCVGHVDEYTSFVPDETAPRGFRFVIADTDLAWELLEEMGDEPLPRYRGGAGHNIDSVGEILEDAGLRALNRDLQDNYITPTVELFREKMDLQDEEILLMPDLFERVPGFGSCNASLIPGMVNLIVHNPPGGQTHVFLADPFTRADLTDQDRDPFIAYVRDHYPAELEFHFLDNWRTYHRALGEVHCGTNVRRPPGAEWWTRAMHLLED